MFLVEDLINDSRAAFEDEKRVSEEFLNNKNYSVKNVQVQECSIIRHRDYYDLWSVFQIEQKDGKSYYIRAHVFSDAIVEYFLNYGDCTDITVYEYEIEDFKKFNFNGYSVDCNVFSLNSLSKNLLKKLTKQNRDWCAYCINIINCMQSEEELIEYEKDCHTYSNVDEEGMKSIIQKYGNYHLGFENITPEHIKNYCNYVWKTYMFWESIYYTMAQYSFFLTVEKEKTTTVNQTLFWTYFFEGWGGADCGYPYQFYKKFLNGEFDNLYPNREELLKIFP